MTRDEFIEELHQILEDRGPQWRQWTTYGDVSRAIGGSADWVQAIPSHFGTDCTICHTYAHRVLHKHGMPGNIRRSVDYDESRSQRRQLEDEGIPFDEQGRADPAFQVYLADSPRAPMGNPEPKQTTRESSRPIRDNAVSRFVKKLYDFQCQVCGLSLRTGDGGFIAIGAHVQPLGEEGADQLKNLLCLCPNHHDLLDTGGIWINGSLCVFDYRGEPVLDCVGKPALLTFKPEHGAVGQALEWHRRRWGLP